MVSEHGLNFSRRDFVKTGVGLLGAGALGSTAGCLLFGGKSSSYTNWMYQPGTVANSDHYGFNYINLSDYREIKDVIGERAYDSVTRRMSTQLGYLGVRPRNVGKYITFGGVTVFSDLDAKKQEMMNELESNNWTKDSKYNGYSIYFLSGATSAAISDKNAVFARKQGSKKAVEIVKTAIDTKKGKEERYVKNKDFKLLISKLGTGSSVQGRTNQPPSGDSMRRGQFAGQVANGSKLELGKETTSILSVYVFEDSGKVKLDKIESYVNSSMKSLPYELKDISTSKEGRTAVLEGKVKTTALFGNVGQVDPAPQVNFDFEQNGSPGEQGSTLTITHAAGEKIDNRDGQTLVIRINGEKIQKQFPNEEITAGDRVEIDISQYSEDDTVQVIWMGDDRSRILSKYELS